MTSAATRLAPSFIGRLPIGTDPASVSRPVKAMEHVLEGLCAIPDFFRSNTRKLKIIRRHIDRHHPGAALIDT